MKLTVEPKNLKTEHLNCDWRTLDLDKLDAAARNAADATIAAGGEVFIELPTGLPRKLA